MPYQFLTQEWIDASKAIRDKYAAESAKVTTSIRMNQVITEAPFGDGDVRLVELASQREIDDNIAAFWRPARPLAAGQEHRFAYRLSWGAEPAPATGRARVALWGDGVGQKPGHRRFFVDFEPPGAAPEQLAADVTASAGHARGFVIQPNHLTGGVRLNFEFDPAGSSVSELRASLKTGGRACTETWTYRWAA